MSAPQPNPLITAYTDTIRNQAAEIARLKADLATAQAAALTAQTNLAAAQATVADHQQVITFLHNMGILPAPTVAAFTAHKTAIDAKLAANRGAQPVYNLGRYYASVGKTSTEALVRALGNLGVSEATINYLAFTFEK